MGSVDASLPPLDLMNVQGDILEGLAKKAETFLFFNISNASTFRTHLAAFIPLITSVRDARNFHQHIADNKKEAARHGKKPALLEHAAINIAFSQKGLDFLGIKDDLKDPAFKQGMKAGAAALGDDLNDWDAPFKNDIHGVIIIAADSVETTAARVTVVKHVFHFGQKGGLVEVKELVGKTRPGAEDGHEHFGFNDGLSQPAVNGLETPAQRGQETVAQGIVLLGRDGDNGIAPPGSPGNPNPLVRPAWALDSSFLAFRYLKQLVPEFNAFLDANALNGDVPHPTKPGDPTGADLLGARLVGRWKSGAPVDATPTRDDPELAKPQNNQFFRYDPTSQVRCPFAAHTRKTNPKADLDGLGGTEIHRILRRGIQFGPEVTNAEKAAKKSSDADDLERGLLFACYQSNIVNGFQFVQESWANAAGFPPGKVVPNTNPPKALNPGIDPLIGVGTPREMVGSDPSVSEADVKLNFMQKWVIPRGGEYFISPSISALKQTFAKSPVQPRPVEL